MNWIFVVICLLIAGALWYLGYGMGYERGLKKSEREAGEYQSKYMWAVDRYDDLLDRYMRLKETLAKVVDKNE